MTREEYEKKKRRLEALAEEKRQEAARACAAYDTLCEELRGLRLDWREQQAAVRAAAATD